MLTITLFTCKAKVYTIKGVVPQMEDNTSVFIADALGENKIDTAIVENGAFSFRGQPIDSIFYYIHFSNRLMRPIPVILEAGNIKIKADNSISVTGTPLNNKNEAFQKSLLGIKEDSHPYILDFINANLNNPIGLKTLKEYIHTIDLADLKKISAKIPKKYENNETTISVRKLIKDLDETAIGKKFKDIKALTPEGNEISLSDYIGKNKIVLLHLWASWCPPCRRDMPYFVEIYNKYKDKGLEIVGVSLDKDKESWTKGIKELDMTWPQMSDLKFWENEIAKTYTIQAIPYIILFDENGIIIDRNLFGKELDNKLNKLLE